MNTPVMGTVSVQADADVVVAFVEVTKVDGVCLGGETVGCPGAGRNGLTAGGPDGAADANACDEGLFDEVAVVGTAAGEDPEDGGPALGDPGADAVVGGKDVKGLEPGGGAGRKSDGCKGTSEVVLVGAEIGSVLASVAVAESLGAACEDPIVM